MFKNITICTIFLAVLALPTIINADDIVPLSYPPKVAYMVLANEIAAQHGVSAQQMKSIVKCESSWNPIALKSTKREYSVGLSQINLKAHRDVTIAEAQNPTFALNFLAEGLSTGRASMWACAHVK